MARIASLIVLAVLIVVIGLLTFEVMAAFILPLFLAGMTAVIFKPLHLWLTKKCRGHDRAAAGLTTLIILLCVLLPSAAVGIFAASETASLIESFDRDAVAARIDSLRTRLSIGPPPNEVVRALDRMQRTIDRLEFLPHEAADDIDGRLIDMKPLLESLAADAEVIERRLNLSDAEAPPAAPVGAPTATPTGTAAADARPALDIEPPERLVETWDAFRKQLAEVKPEPDDPDWRTEWNDVRGALLQFQHELFGGPIAAWIKRNVNVEPDQLQGIIDRTRSAAGPWALGTTQVLAGFFVEFTVGLAVMLLASYYFLADGHEIADSVMSLTPLDRQYAVQLGKEFGNLTRAVVLSMLLAAVAQGVLAALGYWFCGLSSVFLLFLLTTVFSMVPLVGATVVWGAACVWLYFEGHTGAAIGLAVYCAVVVSMADNIIKPLILHGRSNLHPLAALLSVLGGVQALGPIGVFVGPMVVALLHTLLVMLRKELKNFDKKSTTPTVAT